MRLMPYLSAEELLDELSKRQLISDKGRQAIARHYQKQPHKLFEHLPALSAYLIASNEFYRGKRMAKPQWSIDEAFLTEYHDINTIYAPAAPCRNVSLFKIAQNHGGHNDGTLNPNEYTTQVVRSQLQVAKHIMRILEIMGRKNYGIALEGCIADKSQDPATAQKALSLFGEEFPNVKLNTILKKPETAKYLEKEGAVRALLDLGLIDRIYAADLLKNLLYGEYNSYLAGSESIEEGGLGNMYEAIYNQRDGWALQRMLNRSISNNISTWIYIIGANHAPDQSLKSLAESASLDACITVNYVEFDASHMPLNNPWLIGRNLFANYGVININTTVEFKPLVERKAHSSSQSSYLAFSIGVSIIFLLGLFALSLLSYKRCATKSKPKGGAFFDRHHHQPSGTAGPSVSSKPKLR
ncbi:MAG TPA: hypothetical protein VD770_01500 [Coxiellaceae bacterium]|nr:hypothetical protein [Coxiellaceae bacterium]